MNELKEAAPKVSGTETTELTTTSTTWLPESIYQVYGQFLNQYKDNSEELSEESLKKEEEIIEKLLHLFKNRLKDVKESIMLIKSTGEIS